MKTINVSPIIHRNKKRLQLLFDFDAGLIEKIKKLPDSKWSSTKKCWHIPYQENYLTDLQSKLGKEVQ